MARIGIDIDGVCYGFSEAFCDLREWEHKADRWEFYKDFDMSTEGFLKTCRSLVRRDLLFKTGHLLPGTKEAFDALLADGHSIHLVTDRLSLAEGNLAVTNLIKSHTQMWLADNGLKWATLTFDGDKAKVAKELELDYFLDDKLENYTSLLGGEVHAFLFDRPWNQDGPDQQHADEAWRVSSWNEFVSDVHELEKQKLWKLPIDEVRIISNTGGQKGQKLARLGSIDPRALMTVAEVAGFGEKKYARLNYLNGYDWSLSYDACQRHLNAFWSGVDLDSESGLPHLAHAAWHCLAMLAFLQHNIGTDDRFFK